MMSKGKGIIPNQKSNAKHDLNQKGGLEVFVQKYGGATLSSPEKIKEIARQIALLKQEQKSIVVVVSAMGKTTDQLIQLAHEISPFPNLREMDMLLTVGERISMSLVSMALSDLGFPSISLTGSQAGILTNESHVNARIKNINGFRVEEALKEGKIVVLAGFQGVSQKTKEITTLGRGGSDTTAIAMSSYLKAQRCEILKDVPSIFSADPQLIPDAKPIHELTYDQLLEMTFWGAKVLHFRSVELAKLNQVPLYIGSSKHRHLGTSVCKELTMYENQSILSLNSYETVIKVSIPSKDLTHSVEWLSSFLKENQISQPQILLMQSSQEGLAGTDLFLTGPKELTSSLIQLLSHSQTAEPPTLLLKDILCSITATGFGVSSEEIIAKVLSTLSSHQIPVSHFLIGASSLTLFIEQALREKTLSKLHSLCR